MSEKSCRSPFAGRPTVLRPHRLPTRLAAGLALLCCFFVLATADDFSSRDPFFAALTTPMTSIQDGKPFREALLAIADQVELNLWLDRKVDPTAPVAAGPVGPTVSAAIEELAARRNCVVMPVANVMLVGRPQWVDATAASLLSLQVDGNAAAVADISWDMLTTPESALKIAVNDESARVTPPLPHDLWPANHWKQIDRRVAVTLVLAQFDRRPVSSESLSDLASVPASTTGTFSRRYWTGSQSTAIRAAMQKVDRNSRFRVRDDWLEASGGASAHRAAVGAMLAKRNVAAMPDPDHDKRIFSLKPTRSSAENLLRQFAETAGRKCVIHPDAIQACKGIVTIEAKDNTLVQLIEKAAKAAGVVATWQGDTILVTLGQPGC